MTREIAKVLATILTNHIAVYEAQFGEIKLPVPDSTPESEEDQPVAEGAIDATELAPAG
jgi:hypothetical protein